jgi:hypothetical protein
MFGTGQTGDAVAVLATQAGDLGVTSAGRGTSP